MKEKFKIQKGSRGITLIALVITIIVLLILAAVSIATLTGENGILTKANGAKSETAIGEEKEQISLAYSAVMANKMKEKDDSGVTSTELQGELNNLNANATATPDNNKIKVTFNKTGNVYTINSEGRIEGPISSEGGSTPSVTETLSIGDYVDYDPTKADAAKTQELDEETQAKLSYTSPTGTIPTESTGIITHGNGYTSTETGGGQTFTAKPSSELKWRILSVTEDKVELISETPVSKNDTSDESGLFVLRGGIGYLYAEQELNSICAIYGYGYGADTSVGASYTVGGPEDTPITGKIEGTGARSLTIEDINKFVGITEADFTTLNSNYGNTINPSTEVYYPTLSSTNTSSPGQSTSKKAGFKDTSYTYLSSSSKITNTDVLDTVFGGACYWLASRSIGVVNTDVDFCVDFIITTKADNPDLWEDPLSYQVFGNPVGGGASNELYIWGQSPYFKPDGFVRPVVTLKSEVIDTNTDYETVGSWKLK